MLQSLYCNVANVSGLLCRVLGNIYSNMLPIYFPPKHAGVQCIFSGNICSSVPLKNAFCSRETSPCAGRTTAKHQAELMVYECKVKHEHKPRETERKNSGWNYNTELKGAHTDHNLLTGWRRINMSGAWNKEKSVNHELLLSAEHLIHHNKPDQHSQYWEWDFTSSFYAVMQKI